MTRETILFHRLSHHHQPNHSIYYFFSRNKKIMEKSTSSASVVHVHLFPSLIKTAAVTKKNLLNIRMRRKNRLFSPFAKISHLLQHSCWKLNLVIFVSLYMSQTLFSTQHHAMPYNRSNQISSCLSACISISPGNKGIKH